ncbi:hypothetical protein H1P_780002 [Hyella patelloides LEGE 07179]|uniref:Uncharacterized protein n=1 Tax=Hyella patelloides LEGE 07179 TaxID=945734 RepID=A0A563W4D2_9CYAN|nr:hypothetical protein [Hyella patelloides]VEP18393.1 hypothetical protein H1P_780002 [Hyella patelloides LEGE 07179]
MKIVKQRLILKDSLLFVKVDSYIKQLGNHATKKYGLIADEDIYFCTKR